MSCWKSSDVLSLASRTAEIAQHSSQARRITSYVYMFLHTLCAPEEEESKLRMKAEKEREIHSIIQPAVNKGRE